MDERRTREDNEDNMLIRTMMRFINLFKSELFFFLKNVFHYFWFVKISF